MKMRLPASWCSIVILCFLFTHFSGMADDIAIVKKRVVDELKKTPVDDNRVEAILAKLNDEGSFNDINYEDLSRRAGFPQRNHTYNLVYLAKAYNCETSSYYKDKKLLKQIDNSLKNWVEHDYFGDNWHNNQISTPTNLVNLMLLVGDKLSKEYVEGAQPIIGRAHMNASGARPSGDRIVIAGILAKNLLFIGDDEQFEDIIELIEGEVKFSTGQRGMQQDYSFHHRVDRVNNTISYGYGKYANNFGEWSYYVAGTKYAFSVEKINQLVDYYLDGIYKQLVYGVYTDISVKNRSISHKATFEPRATLEIERLLLSTDYRKDELEEILKLRKGEAEPSLSFAKFFWQTEHFVIQRPNYYTTVRMYSTRNRNMEVPYNGPGKLTHHRADGTNYIQIKGDEYHNIWPVYDWQKISGTTIMQKPELPSPDDIQKDGLTNFVGAVTDGMIGSVAFDFRSPHDMTVAKKAWFFFDREYVCLGAGIRASQRLPVVTTVDQVLMHGDVTIMQNKEQQVLERGSRSMDNIKWVHQGKVGYVFPDPATVTISNQVQEGRWCDITDQKNISDELIQKDVFALWFDHGERPRNTTYAYMVIPAVEAEEVASTATDNRGIEILSNTADLQAVRHIKANNYQLAFYKSGEVELAEGGKVQLSSQGMLMLEMQDGKVKRITGADPSRQLGQLSVTVPGIYDAQGEGFMTIPGKEANTTTFVIDLPQGVYAGKSVAVEL